VIKHGFSVSSQGYIWAELMRGQPIIVECERIYIRSSTLYAGGRVGAFFDLEDLAILAARGACDLRLPRLPPSFYYSKTKQRGRARNDMCVLRNPEFAGKMDWGIEWIV